MIKIMMVVEGEKGGWEGRKVKRKRKMKIGVEGGEGMVRRRGGKVFKWMKSRERNDGE